MGLEEGSDAEWMRRLQQGDTSALNDIMRKWKGPLVSFVYRLLRNEVEANEVAQETFVKIYEQRLRYRGGTFSTWMFTIASNLSKNIIRSRERKPTVSMTVAGDEPGSTRDFASAAASPDAALIAGERHREIAAAIEALDPDSRIAIVLSQYEDLSHAQIAEVLKCTPKAVEARLYRARAQLKNTLVHLMS
jgi:RNA polymerase sigma-70 factor (ECF subfamily)